MIDSRVYKDVAKDAEIQQLRSQDDPRVKLINMVISDYKDLAKFQLLKNILTLQKQFSRTKQSGKPFKVVVMLH